MSAFDSSRMVEKGRSGSFIQQLMRNSRNLTLGGNQERADLKAGRSGELALLFSIHVGGWSR